MLSIIGLLVAAAIVFLIVRSITVAVTNCVQFAEAVASGDLDQELRVSRQDEIGVLGTSLNSMVTRLKELGIMPRKRSFTGVTSTLR